MPYSFLLRSATLGTVSHPPLISRKYPSGGSNRSDQLRPAPHLRQRNATVSQQEGHSLQRHQGLRIPLVPLHARSQTAKPSRTERYKPTQAPPSHGSASSTGKITLASSIKHAHGKTKASETKAPRPRVARRRRGATLGILYLLGSGYKFQGWHFSKEREAGRVSQGCAERIISCCAHLRR